MQELNPSRGFQSSMDYTMTIGLGKAEKVDSLRVIWPDDHSQKFTNLAVNQLLDLKQTDAEEIYTIPKKKEQFHFLDEMEEQEVVTHEENTYVDFDYEGMTSKMLSQEGPTLAVADVNFDGNEDVFVGGAKMQPGTLYLNVGKGKLKKSTQKSLEEDAIFEDTASAFFDADGDGDLDLLVGSGGNQMNEERTYRPRLYLNDGKGNFSKTADLPSKFRNIAVVAPYDFDGDGDEDIFVGSRSVVGTYGIDPDHLFLENQGNGKFIDATERVAWDLKDAGMITDAVWADVDGDNRKDLITVSEWGTPHIFRNTGRRLALFPTNLDSLTGWWNAVEVADFDNDGDNDLVIGNKGSNTPYRTSGENPIKMYINDFDNNGTIEQIVTRRMNGRDFPIHMKKEMTTQLSFLKKQNLKASEYAKKSIDELFPKEIFQNSIVKTASNEETLVAVNDGNGKFSFRKLPSRVQLSCVCGITCSDLNGDGNLDLIMGGNNFDFKPQFSRLDASYGHVLLGDGKMDFSWQDYGKSGFFVKNEIKHLKRLKDKDGNSFIVAAINNQKPKIFRINEK